MADRGAVLQELADTKTAANQLHISKKFSEALAEYEFILSALAKHPELLDSNDGKLLQQACHLNAAASCLELERGPETRLHCDAVIERNAKCVKAFVRRGKAFELEGELSRAMEDYEKALALEPELESVKDLLNQLIISQKTVEVTVDTISSNNVSNQEWVEIPQWVEEEAVDADFPIEFKKLEGRGRAVTAKRALRAGETVMSCERAMSTAVSSDRQDTVCDTCFGCDWPKSGEPRPLKLQCGSCGIRWCSPACKEACLKLHDVGENGISECRAFQLLRQQQKGGQDTKGSRMLIRLLLRLDRNPTLLSHFQTLMSGESEVHASSDSIALGVCQILGRTDLFEVAKESVSKVHVNSHGVVNFEGQNLGTALWSLGSFFNHSCDPNCVLVLDKSGVSFRCIRAVGKGEELCVSYVNLYQGRKDRQSVLKRIHGFFPCSCSRCSDGSIELQVRGGRLGETWVADTDPRLDQSVLSRCRESLAKGRLLFRAGELTGAVQALSATLAEGRPVLHPHHEWLFIANGVLFNCFMSLGRFKEAAAACADVIGAMEAVYPRFHPELPLQYNALAHAYMSLANSKGNPVAAAEEIGAAVKAVQRTKVLQSVVFGKAHPKTLESAELLEHLKRYKV